MSAGAASVRGAPLDPLRAVLALEDARDREEIFELVLRAARSRAPRVALLAVHGDSIRARRAIPEGWLGELEAVQLPRHTVPALEAAIESRAPSIGPLGDAGSAAVVELAGPASTALVLPIAVGARTIALVVGHRTGAGAAAQLIAGGTADLAPVLTAANLALARVQAGRARTAQPVRAATAGYELEIAFESSVAARRAALARHRQLEAWAPLADTIRELIREGMEGGDPDEDEQLELLLELGRIEADRLDQPDRALETWRAARTIDAGDVRVLDALESAMVRRGQWRACIELLEDRVAITHERIPRIAVLLNLATIAHERLGDTELATDAYARVLAWDPDHELASRTLERLYEAGEQWQALAALLLDRASGHADAEAGAAALEWVAQMYELKAADPHAAYLVWLAVIRRDPDRPDTVDELDRLAAASTTWHDLAAPTAALAGDLAAAHPAVAGKLWRLAGDLYDARLARPDEALAAYEHARTLDPAAAPVLVALHRGYLARDAWPELGDLLPALIDALSPTAPLPVLVELHVELGSVLVDHLARPDDAVRAFNDALALDPAHVAAFAGLTRAYRVTGQTDALLDATEALVDLAPRDEQAPRYGALAAAWHDQGRFERAAATWHKLRVLDPRATVAHAGLARALAAGEDWIALADALRARLAVTEAPARGPLWVELLDVLERRLDDLDGACAVAAQIVAVDPDHRVAQDALARLHARAGRLTPALDALHRLLALAAEPAARADILQRIGQLHLDERDATSARTHLLEAIALDPRNARAHDGLARVHVQQGELAAAGEELVRAANLSGDRGEAIRCLADAAWLYRHRLGDSARARSCVQRILELEPENGDARHALGELLHDAQAWEELWPHLEVQVARATDDAPEPDVGERIALFTRAARCALELGKVGVALELYDRACALDPTPVTAIERAAALVRGKSPDAAATAYQAIAARYVGMLDRAQLIGIYRRLAQLFTELAQPAQAHAFHHKVLALDVHHRDTLAELVELNLARGHLDEAIASLRGLVAETSAVADRVALLERVGDLYRHQLANAGRATSAYLEALELDPGNRRLLQRVLDAQTESGQWRLAVRTIERFLDHETEPARRGAYFLAAAEIRRSELKDAAGALDCYESGLDELLREEPLRAVTRARALEAFHAVERRAIAAEDWKSLEASYRRMIKRLRADDPLVVELWDELGSLYRLHLDHPHSAIQALESAHALDPDKSARRRRVLVELYAMIGEVRPVSITDPSAGAATAPTPRVRPETTADPEAYRALAVAAIEAGRLDEAWCVCRALVVLDHATPKEQAFYRKYQIIETRRPAGIVDEDAWAMLRHPDEDRVISSIFAIAWQAVAALRAGSAKSFALRPKDRLAVATDTRVTATMFRHAARVLNVAVPEVYAQPRQPGRLMIANCLDKGRLAPAVIVGRDLMIGYRDTELAAVIGSLVAQLRPSYYLKLTLPAIEELEAALAAAARLVGRAVGRPALAPLVGIFMPRLQDALTPAVAQTLRAFVAHLPDELDLVTWRNAVEATADRAALVVSGELAATARMVASERTPLGGVGPGERVRELVAYAVSPDYFALRRRLGITVA